MNADMYRSLKHSWAMARKRRAVDKKGLAVALAFLLVMFFVVRTCSDMPTGRVSHALQELPEVSKSIQAQQIQNKPDWLDASFRFARHSETNAEIEADNSSRRQWTV